MSHERPDFCPLFCRASKLIVGTYFASFNLYSSQILLAMSTYHHLFLFAALSQEAHILHTTCTYTYSVRLPEKTTASTSCQLAESGSHVSPLYTFAEELGAHAYALCLMLAKERKSSQAFSACSYVVHATSARTWLQSGLSEIWCFPCSAHSGVTNGPGGGAKPHQRCCQGRHEFHTL